MRKGAWAAGAAAAWMALPLLGMTARADSTPSPFDATNLSGGCAALELTIGTGYSFVVQPDVQLPRATTVVEEGQSQAVASPADPGDSADALAGLGVPEAEGYIANGYPAAPSPFAGKGAGSLPAPLNSVGAAVMKNPFNPALTFPYEHADAGYPNAASPGTQTATLGGLPNAGVGDPSGFFNVNGGLAKAVAGDGFATADGGAGTSAAATAPGVPLGLATLGGLGVSVGRVSAHSEAHVLSDRVTHDATCSLDSVQVAVPGAAALHIGAVVAKVHTERVLSAAAATATESIEFSGVTVNGQGATLDQGGLTVGGRKLATLPAAPAAAQAPVPTAAPAPGLLPGAAPAAPPVVAAVTKPPTVTVTGTNVTTTQPSADEATVGATGATIEISTVTPIPNTPNGSRPDPNAVGVTPTVYTLHIASLASEAYGLPATNTNVGLGDLAAGVAGVLGGGVGDFNQPTGSGGGHQGLGSQPALASVTVTPVQRTIILVVSSLLEAAVLATIVRNYLRSRRRVTPPAETTDLP